MLDEGICVKTNPVAAAHFYERAAGLGDKAAALDYARPKSVWALAALGIYERAGDLCHDAGLNPEGKLSRYSLGYVCTVRAVAGKLLRTSLPRGAFLGDPPNRAGRFHPCERGNACAHHAAREGHGRAHGLQFSHPIGECTAGD